MLFRSLDNDTTISDRQIDRGTAPLWSGLMRDLVSFGSNYFNFKMGSRRGLVSHAAPTAEVQLLVRGELPALAKAVLQQRPGTAGIDVGLELKRRGSPPESRTSFPPIGRQPNAGRVGAATKPRPGSFVRLVSDSEIELFEPSYRRARDDVRAVALAFNAKRTRSYG